MAELIYGRNYLSFFRLYEDRTTDNGEKLKFMTESSTNKEKETETHTTFDGPVNSVNDGVITEEFTSLAYREDSDVVAMWEILEQAFDDNKLVEFWRVDSGSLSSTDSKVDVVYHQGYFTSFSITYPPSGPVELSFTYTVNGKGVRGTDALTADQLKAVRELQYEYKTIAKVTGV